MQHFGVCKKRAFGILMPLPGLLNDKYRQAVRIMKITAFIILVCTLQVSAAGYSQSITLSEKEASLGKVFKLIEKQTDYIFFYNVDWVKRTEKVDVEVKNMQLQQVLELLFKNQPITYSITGKMITVFPKKDEINSNNSNAMAPRLNLHGTVVDENGKSIPGVTVAVNGTHKMTVTDHNGEFVFRDVDSSASLSFSSVNMESFQVDVRGQAEIIVRLKSKTNELDAVQIIAYGQTTTRLRTGNVSTVKGKDIQKQPVNNALLALEGRVPGLQISQSTGYAGTAVSLLIRGKNSINNGTNPLIVIDGVPYTSQLLPNLNPALGSSTGGGTNSPGNYGNPLSYLNPMDIESIEVLKDADATSIYGSRAGNGAILITTKTGKAGKTKVDINVRNGWSKVPHHLDLLNTQQYMQMRHEAFANDASSNQKLYPDVNGLWDTTRYTDWQKVLIGGTANYLDAHATVSGGNEYTQFLIGGGYHRETSVFPWDFADQKGSLRFSINNNSKNNRFKIQLSGNYTFDDNKLPPIDLTGPALTLAPDAPQLYNGDGTLNWAPSNPTAPSFGTWTNPLATLNYNFDGRTKNLITSSLVSYELIPGLIIKSNLGYTDMHINEVSQYPASFFDPYLFSLVGSTLRSSSFADNSITSWIIEPQVTYSKTIKKLELEALVGTTIQQSHRESEIINGVGYSSDLLLGDIKSAATNTVNHHEMSVYKYNALFTRLSFNWFDKYLINLAGRRDGSSRFGSSNQFHNFYSIGTGWIFTKESFIQKNLGILSFGKIRASYGTTGNDQIGDYQFMDLYQSYNTSSPYQGGTALVSTSLSNPYLQWEETKKAEVSLELGFFKDRIFLSASSYQNRSSNELLNVVLPTVTGFGSIPSNLPATVQNSGVEFVLNSANFKSASFKWTTSINLTIPRNKLVSFPGLESSAYSKLFKIGSPITDLLLYHGMVDPQTGIYKFSDGKENFVFNPTSTDNPYYVRINPDPKFYGGIENSFSYKGFQLDFLFQFVKQKGKNYFYGFLPGYFNRNQPVSVLDNRWQHPSDQVSIQRFASSTGSNVNGNSLYNAYNYSIQSDLIYSDASYARLKNLSLSWQFPNSLSQRMHIQNCLFYIQGQNLLTITNYKGLDPETQSSTSLPVLRVWTVGIQISL